jgi:hypothetical protein
LQRPLAELALFHARRQKKELTFSCLSLLTGAGNSTRFSPLFSLFQGFKTLAFQGFWTLGRLQWALAELAFLLSLQEEKDAADKERIQQFILER